MTDIPEDFFVNEITLHKVTVGLDSISIAYLVDGEENNILLKYPDVRFDSGLFKDASKKMQFAVSLGVFGAARFGAVLPGRVDLSKYKEWIHPDLISFMQYVLRGHWSEHRYQVGRMDYRHPVFFLGEEEGQQPGLNNSWPIWELHNPPHKVLLASGSGKDSVLCSLMLESAGISYDVLTYLYDYYGSVDNQDNLFSKVNENLKFENQYKIVVHDEYFPWLNKRMAEFNIDELTNNFRKESGEVYFFCYAIIPVQLAKNLCLQVYGNEKSADRSNLIDDKTGEMVAHQWAKSYASEKAFHDLYSKMFGGINFLSLTKPIHDVKVFETLFRLDPDIAYHTNSCNIKKPWCCRCEKCAYVFLGFSTFGDHKKVVTAFGKDLFDDPELLPIWEELLGLKGYIPWECVGHPEEVQLYFYKISSKGIKGCAITLFEQKILPEIPKQVGIENYFSKIEDSYSKVYEDHHSMPTWLWQPIKKVLQ